MFGLCLESCNVHYLFFRTHCAFVYHVDTLRSGASPCNLQSSIQTTVHSDVSISSTIDSRLPFALNAGELHNYTIAQLKHGSLHFISKIRITNEKKQNQENQTKNKKN